MSIRSILVSLLGVTVGALLPSCAHKHSYSDPALAAAISGSYRQIYPPHYSQTAASLALGQGAGTDQALMDSEKLGSFTRRSGGPHVVATLRYDEMSGVRKLNDGIEPKLHRGMTPVAADMFEVGLSVGGKKAILPWADTAAGPVVLGPVGQTYEILVRNHTKDAYEMVVGVDGFDARDGRAASIAKRGFVIPPNGSAVIRGFRKDEKTVQPFVFAATGRAGLVTAGLPTDLGVIRLSFFEQFKANAEPPAPPVVRTISAKPVVKP